MTDIAAGLPPAPDTGSDSPAPEPPSRPDSSTPRPRWLLPATGLAFVLLALWALVALRRPAETPAPVPSPASPAEAAPASLAETVGEEGHLAIAVLSLDRVAADTVELRLAVTNTAPAGTPALDVAQRFSADGPDRGTLAEVYLADLTHERKFFVLRDGQNAPLGSRDDAPLAAGERRVLWARYPAPRDEDTEVVVHVPHAEPMPNVPVGVRTGAQP